MVSTTTRTTDNNDNDKNNKRSPPLLVESSSSSSDSSKKNKKKKNKKKKNKKRKREQKVQEEQEEEEEDNDKKKKIVFRPLVENHHPHSHNDNDNNNDNDNTTITLLLFYQYCTPPWTSHECHSIVVPLLKQQLSQQEEQITGRLRIATEGLNGTLTGTFHQIRTFIQFLRNWEPTLFRTTEFKLTHGLSMSQRFKTLKVLPVTELVHYGFLQQQQQQLSTTTAATHLEPAEYRDKLMQNDHDTVVIDVRNHYEALIGHFDHANYVDPGMRKSTDFSAWLDDNQEELLRNKQVLMFCTGGIRCERASALLKHKMETDPVTKKLNIKGVYQLQGGIDKYLREFPDGGGQWKGKNYTFDKRFAHGPADKTQTPLSKCQNCQTPWDKYRGKRRCVTCGVPSLLCPNCLAQQTKLSVRCDICVQQGIMSKREWKARQEQQQARQQQVQQRRQVQRQEQVQEKKPAPATTTRLFIRNMCRQSMTEQVLKEWLPQATHVVWRTTRTKKKKGQNNQNQYQNQFTGQGWVEMKSLPAAAQAVHECSGTILLGRRVYLSYDPPNDKDCWPPPKSALL